MYFVIADVLRWVVLLTCVFFGHKDTPSSVKEELEKLLIDLIVNKGIKHFLVGNNGSFDFMVKKVLSELEKSYDITYSIVLAYLPKDNHEDCSNTLFPEGIELAPKRFAITYRNRWLVNQSDFVVCYVNHSYGGAWQYMKMAQSKNKTVINLGIL